MLILVTVIVHFLFSCFLIDRFRNPNFPFSFLRSWVRN
jgi:hypothetical protein